MKLLMVIAGMLILALFLSWKAYTSVWIQVETNSPQVQQYARMAGTTLQIKHIIKDNTGEETVVISNGISGPK
ncbi:hypothetical protein P8868_15395 [Bacillus inaquosorum]|uniref:hypothetical protein n=1 Tax=Bacillus inaquosorum TaxID=483913 RepID=UPI00227DB0D2|nr:hypothetical protein [Bacillus inaquosorum]MCY8374536.1 hypothetical protein [Bacillus inaquosorum]MEC0558943.1 hypothetical protein [Bacillus inaquosorum]